MSQYSVTAALVVKYDPIFGSRLNRHIQLDGSLNRGWAIDTVAEVPALI